MALIDGFADIAKRLNELEGKPARTIYDAGKQAILSGAGGGHSHGFSAAFYCSNCNSPSTYFVMHKDSRGNPQPWCTRCDEERF